MVFDAAGQIADCKDLAGLQIADCRGKKLSVPAELFIP